MALPRLTPTETAIMDLLSEGFSRTQIRRTMGIAENTLKSHLGNIKSKSGTRGALYRTVVWYMDNYRDGDNGR